MLSILSDENWVLSACRKLALISVIASAILLIWRYPALPPSVPLWYGKPWGTERLAHPLWLILLPGGSFLILIVNVMVSRLLSREMLIFAQILALTALLVSVLSLVTLTKIMFLVS
ncbi:hypothetical protein HY949_04575 [Candidatus Gottesmanbacteria bacterium]|nr:hypothetical protein [Candidatus Gottesmanbacteria bacterium]